MAELVTFISLKEHLFATGGAKGFLSAKLFETLMRKTEIYAFSYSMDHLNDAASYLRKDDLSLIFSASGDPNYIQKVTNLKRVTLLMTANPNVKRRQYFDRVITLPTLSGGQEYGSIPSITSDIFTELLVTHYAKQVKS